MRGSKNAINFYRLKKLQTCQSRTHNNNGGSARFKLYFCISVRIHLALNKRGFKDEMTERIAVLEIKSVRYSLTMISSG